MHSRLRQRTFEAIRTSHPCCRPGCNHQLELYSHLHEWRPLFPVTIRRSLFGLANWQLQEEHDKKVENSTRQMVQLSRAVKQRSRPPPSAILAKAFKSFVQGHFRNPNVLSKTHAQYLFQTFKYVASNNSFENSKGVIREILELSGLEDALIFLAQSKWELEARETVNDFAKFIFKQISHQNSESEYSVHHIPALKPYVSVLAVSGSTHEALAIIENCLNESTSVMDTPWLVILKGFILEENQEMANVVLQKMRQRSISIDQIAIEDLLFDLIKEGQVKKVKMVYEDFLASHFRPTVRATEAVINVALRHQMTSWAFRVFDSIPNGFPAIEKLSISLLLASSKGEKPDQILQKLNQAVNADTRLRSKLTISIFNRLMGYANEVKRYDFVEAYGAAIRDWGLDPDSRTFALWIGSRLELGDVPGAICLYQELEAEHQQENSDLILNKLIRGLCRADKGQVDYDMVLSLIDRVFETGGRFECNTLMVLCHSLLCRYDLAGISDLLKPLINSYTPLELALVREPFISYLLDPTQPTERIWEVYEFVNVAFPATPVYIRTKVMMDFFRRNRSDLACLVFGHMRQKELGDERPTRDTYVECLRGLADMNDGESLLLVHNMLKLDLEVGLDTRILNTLMLAYTCCGMPDEAMGFFREILHSEEGPSASTLLIFLRVCETHTRGNDEATKMMEKLKELDINIDRRIYTAFIAALGGHCEIERATEALRGMKSLIGESPTSET